MACTHRPAALKEKGDCRGKKELIPAESYVAKKAYHCPELPAAKELGPKTAVIEVKVGNVVVTEFLGQGWKKFDDSNSKKVTSEQLQQLIHATLVALRKLWVANIVHLDGGRNNLLYDASNQVKFVDFEWIRLAQPPKEVCGERQ
ncbi:unnamed protein product [Didymodactylos carnosus]|nr:unnamed protein product [Didymodactylos carnosus]CAF4391116.1 unnamed protein product [Didymodactylos carnosus]